MRKIHILALVVTHGLTFAAGGAVGIVTLKRKVQDHYDDLMAEEVAETKKFYKDLAKKEYETPEEALKALHGEESIFVKSEKALSEEMGQVRKEADEALERYQGKVHEAVVDLMKSDKEPEKPFTIANSAAHILADKPEVPEAVRKLRARVKDEREKTDEEKIDDWNKKQERDRNIFTASEPPPAKIMFNQENDPTLPYIISEDVWNENAGDQEQEILMYYTGDSTLVNDHEMVLDPGDIEFTIGSKELIQFGHLSNDRNAVYIRNPKTNTDYYVLKSDGNYGEEVAGFGSADE